MLGSCSVPGAFRRLAAAPVHGIRLQALQPVSDMTTGLPLLRLPPGFRYASFGWTGDPMSDGIITPGAHDGMGIIADDHGILTLCRNHELGSGGTSFGSASLAYDRKAAGGCTSITFDTNTGAWGRAQASLIGTLKNCAGGHTPWGTWLSCEETVLEDGDREDDEVVELEAPHGYVFEVSPETNRMPQPLKAMGRFVHEAVAVDASSGIVYETEDRKPAGFYRFVPQQRGNLAAGGRLEMLEVHGSPDLIRGARIGATYDVGWVGIEDPDRRHSPGTEDRGGVFQQGREQGGAAFQKLEGCWWGNDCCYFVASHGGRAGKGQVWMYDPRAETLMLIFESLGAELLDCPDNLCVSPRGGLLLCEDGDRVPQRLQYLTATGQLSEFAANNVQLPPGTRGHHGDFRGSEWCGAVFSPDGRWLFANIQNPGLTVAITGDWEALGI